MAVTYSTATKQARMQAVADAIDAGPSYGKIKLYLANGSTLVGYFPLTKPCATPSGAVLTFDVNPDIDAVLSATGTATLATITTSADTVIVSGLTVGTGGTDIVMLSNVVASTGDTVTLQTATLTHA
jgi:hypothetical protein